MPKSLYSLYYILFLISLTILNAKEEETDIEAIISFDLTDPDIIIPHPNDFTEIKNILNNPVRLPKSSLSKPGYNFIGWTPDFIYGYKPEDTFFVRQEKILMKPLFEEKDDKNFYRLSYYVEIDGEVAEVPIELETKKYKQNSLIKISAFYFYCKTKSHLGYQYDGHPFLQLEKLVMPNKDVTLTPVWHNIHNITYYTGDVEGIAGVKSETYQSAESSTRELPEPSRFSRLGYKIVAWHCEYDGKDYPPYYTYSIPDAEIDFYAVWEPLEYNIWFNTGVKEIEKFKIQAKTGTSIIVPEIGGEREGYSFKGWKDDEDNIYLPGDEYFVKGRLPGLGIGFKAEWEKNEE